MVDRPGSARRGRAWQLLLLVPVLAPLPVGLYNRAEPRLWGMPFFYWYQLADALLAMLVITVVYQAAKGRRR
ncbi:hypothetical protein Cs7R123_25310 [Catellatospora sp. TT07R-123]|uniref:DUF3311 domain-containing protein n=1 Tax=Catellatospora sp. TT07R-123 TaxID=2733863 RepID=UPI001B21B88D|nr:DUF3311 domain-containing protein [Catellatospora sp. TT07R-123]GHJ45189.1 hypothetical protein Cs7R123_25310 [Catellatospora sp. TT07R-123]